MFIFALYGNCWYLSSIITHYIINFVILTQLAMNDLHMHKRGSQWLGSYSPLPTFQSRWG